MRVTLALSAALIGCAPDDVIVTAPFPPAAEAAVVIRGDEAWLLERGSITEGLRLDTNEREVTVLYYDASASTLGLEADESGALVRWTANDDPEDAWPLPPTSSGVVLRPGESAAMTVTDPAALAERARHLRVVAPACRGVASIASHPLDAPQGYAHISIASIGDVAVVTLADSTQSPTPLPPIALFIANDAVVTLPIQAVESRGARLYTLVAGSDRFLVVETASMYLRVYDVDLSGRVTRASDPIVAPRFVALASWPESGVLHGLDASVGTVTRVDPWRGTSEIVATLPPPSTTGCRASERLVFTLTSSSSGIASVAGLTPHRFSAGGTPTRVMSGLDLGEPCLHAYVRFASGAELLQHTIQELIGETTHSAWRAATGDWIEDRELPALFGTIAHGEEVLALAPASDALVVLSHAPERPTLRPRICGRAGFGKLRRFSFDGERGFALQQTLVTSPATVIRFRRE